jgi:hypothetical protein
MLMNKSPHDLKRGDVILELDGHKVGKPVEVTKFIESDPDGTAIIEVRAEGSVVSPRRYLRYEQVRVGRVAHLAGLKLIKVDDEHYVTFEGDYSVELTWSTTWCDDPHPVRLGDKTATKIRAAVSKAIGEGADHYRARQYVGISYGYETLLAATEYKKGYYCEGGCEHPLGEWNAWDGERMVGEWSDTPTEAAHDLAEYLKSR